MNDEELEEFFVKFVNNCKLGDWKLTCCSVDSDQMVDLGCGSSDS